VRLDADAVDAIRIAILRFALEAFSEPLVELAELGEFLGAVAKLLVDDVLPGDLLRRLERRRDGDDLDVKLVLETDPVLGR
jgi:hypothetical protein